MVVMNKLSLVLIVLLILHLGCGGESRNQKFNKEKWKMGTQQDRGNRAEDLIKSYELKGKTKSEILELLGQPKDTSEFWYHYLVDYGYMTLFHLEFMFDSTEFKVIKVTLDD